MGFFVVPVAFTRSVFRPSDAARLPIPQLRGYSILAATTPPCFAHPGAAFPRSDNSARSSNPDPSRNPDRTSDWSRTSAARSRFRSPRPVRRSSRLHPAAGLYYKRSFIARHPSQPDNDMRSALAALRSRTRALPPPSLPLAAEHGPFLFPLSSFLAALRSRAQALPSFPSFRLPRLEPGTKKRPHVAVRASVSPKIGRITSRSSRRSP